MSNTNTTEGEKAVIEEQLCAALQGARRLKLAMLAYLLEMALEELAGENLPSIQDWRS